MHFQFIGAPLELGCSTTGSAGAWDALRPAMLAQAADLGAEVSCSAVEVDNTAISPLRAGMNNAETVISVCRDIASEVAAAAALGRFPVLIGGDHSTGYGSIAGMAERYPAQELSVIWVDAHTDINTEETSDSHNIHGMPLAAALGLCGEELSSVGGRRIKIKPENLYIIGARSIDDGEYEIVEKYGVHLYTMQTIRERGLGAVAGEVISRIGTQAVHLSFDVDALDASLFSATGLPIPDGYTPDGALALMARLIESLPVVSFDCVEYNPTLDSGGGRETVETILRGVLDAVCARQCARQSERQSERSSR